MDNDLSSVYTAIEIADMRSTIDDIQKILQTIPFDEDTARQKVYEINAKHPDNKMIWNLLHAKWGAGDILTYASTVALGLLAVWQNQKFKEESDRNQLYQNLLAAKNSDDAIVTRIIDDKTQRVQRIRSEFIEFEHLCNTGTIASICTCTDSKGIMITHLCEHRLKLISLQELLIADLSGNVGVDGGKVIPLIKKLTGLANEQITGYTGSIDIQENHSDIYQKVYVQYIDERTQYLLFCEGLIGSILYDGLSLTDLREIAKKSIQEIVEDKNVKQTSPSDPQPDSPEH